MNLNQENQHNSFHFNLTISRAIGTSYAFIPFAAICLVLGSLSLWSDGAGNQGAARIWIGIFQSIVDIQALLLIFGWKNSIRDMNAGHKTKYIFLCLPFGIEFIYSMPSLILGQSSNFFILLSAFILYQRFHSRPTLFLFITSIAAWIFNFLPNFIPVPFMMFLGVLPMLQGIALLWFSLSAKIDLSSSSI